MNNSKRIKIGLALGSGGAKGLAHIGVIKVLEENNIPIDFIAGSSMGALIGGFYAAKKDIKQLEQIALAVNWKFILGLVDPSFPKGGLLEGRKIKHFIENYLDEMTFKDLKIPFAVVATDLKKGERVIIKEGDLSLAIRASISFPLVFKPVKWKNQLLIDGGLSSPVPVEIVKRMGADLILAVNLDASYFFENEKKNAKLGFYKIIEDSLNLLRYHLAFLECQNADLVIKPQLGSTHWIKFLNSKKIIESGEKATIQILPSLQELISKNKKTA